MIIILMIISAIAFFISFIYIDKVPLRITFTLISGIVFISSIIGIVANYHSHYGMQEITTTTEKQIYSADTTGAMQIILYEPIGTNGDENIFIYSPELHSKKVTYTKVDEFTTNKTKIVNSGTANLKITEVHWKYKSSAYKFWFGIADNNNKLSKQINTFYLPKTWSLLSTSEAKELKQKMSSPEFKKQIKSQATLYIQNKMKNAIVKNPSLATNKSRQLEMQKKFANEFQDQMLKKAIQDVKNK